MRDICAEVSEENDYQNIILNVLARSRVRQT